jgi:3-methyladenine DNA glycosylase AlkC
MVSTASRNSIQERFLIFSKDVDLAWQSVVTPRILQALHTFIEKEYLTIPEKERIGKGKTFITRPISDALYQLLNQKEKRNFTILLDLTEKIMKYSKTIKSDYLLYASIYFLSAWVKTSSIAFQEAENFLMTLANHETWEIREVVLDPFVNALKEYPSFILPKLFEWAKSPNPNIRRVVAECCRPRTGTKWLRDPKKNDTIIQLLTFLNCDSSEYVRKSVGNNLKDLSKYMPEKILKIATDWVSQAQIKVTPDLASKSKSELGPKGFYLIWILKQGLRWLKDRNPEFHSNLEQILGQNFVLHFDEKTNRSAKPK